jgi:hypothetical protein
MVGIPNGADAPDPRKRSKLANIYSKLYCD